MKLIPLFLLIGIALFSILAAVADTGSGLKNLVSGPHIHVLLSFTAAIVISRLIDSKHPELSSFVIVSFFAVIIELVQIFVPGRSAELADIVWGLIGAGLYLVLSLILRRGKFSFLKV